MYVGRFSLFATLDFPSFAVVYFEPQSPTLAIDAIRPKNRENRHENRTSKLE